MGCKAGYNFKEGVRGERIKGVLESSMQLQGVQWEQEVRGAMQSRVQLQNGVL